MTVTKTETLQEVLERAHPNDLADALRKVGGKFFAAIKATFVGLTAAAAHDITNAAHKAAATVLGVTLETGENLPAMATTPMVRVTAGAAAAGPRIITDSGGTPSATVATLSADGTTLTFEGAVTAFVLEYQPRSTTALTEKFAPSV